MINDDKMIKNVLVIIATYNGENFLSEQLESIFNQEKVNVFILVRDDGSTDRTCKLLEQYQTDGKLKWYTGGHLGASKGYYDLMIKAVEYDVDYIAFCDQDDVWDKDKLYIAVQSLNKVNATTPSLYYCGQRIVDEKLNLIAIHNLNEKRTLITRFVLSDFAGCTGVFNKALLNEVIRFEPQYMLMHDTWILKVCLCLGGKVFVDSKVHLNYRQHGKNTIGLGRNLSAYLKQVKQYLCEYQVEQQIQELVRGYYDRMIPEYKMLSTMICDYKKNKKYKKRLLDKNFINFYNKGLNITYWIKVQFNKL